MGQRGRPRKYATPMPDAERMAHHRQQLRTVGYRNLSFMVSPEEYELIERQRHELGLSTKDLLMYFLKGQYRRAARGTVWYISYEEYAERKFADLKNPEAQIEKELHAGDLFEFKAQKPFALAWLSLDSDRFPSWFPYQSRWVRGFVNYQDAMQYYNQYRSARHKFPKTAQHVLLKQINPEDFCFKGPPYPERVGSLYQIVYAFNKHFPEIYVCSHAFGPDYAEEYIKICQEMGLDD